jgi:hypothetical protein
MDPREEAMKAWLDGKFVKFLGTYTEKWPFRTVKVNADFVPQYERKTYGELAQIDGKRGGRITVKPGKGGHYREITPREIEIIRRHAREGVRQLETQSMLRMGSETFHRAKVAAGLAVRKWEGV